MSEYLIQDTTLTDIADAIRSKTGGSALINPEDMASEIESIQASDGYSYSITLSSAPTNTYALYNMVMPQTLQNGEVAIAIKKKANQTPTYNEIGCLYCINATMFNETELNIQGAMRYRNGWSATSIANSYDAFAEVGDIYTVYVVPLQEG